GQRDVLDRGAAIEVTFCNVSDEDLAHLLFRCDLAIEVARLVYRWWNLVWIPTYLGILDQGVADEF
ncbi:hypothetical protein Tco_1322807, partial [Tanacetum coccineum]